MKSALVIFNGIKFPYYLMEYALGQAKQQAFPLHILFLKAKKEIAEGYGYPSDLEQTESKIEIEEGEKEDLNIIHHHMKLAIDMALVENVSCTTELVIECSLSEILSIVKNFEAVYIDAAFDEENSSMLSNDRFTLSDLADQSASVKLVSEDNSAN